MLVILFLNKNKDSDIAPGNNDDDTGDELNIGTDIECDDDSVSAFFDLNEFSESQAYAKHLNKT